VSGDRSNLRGKLTADGREHSIGRTSVAVDLSLSTVLVRIERRGLLGVVELAELAGRDYTTVSRRVAKLEGLGLVRRRKKR
jgi:predicted transcriptional regulator